MLIFMASMQRRGRGAAVALGIPTNQYNDFCSAAFSAKRAIWGISEVDERNLDPGRCFSTHQFAGDDRTPGHDLDVATRVLSYLRDKTTAWATGTIGDGRAFDVQAHRGLAPGMRATIIDARSTLGRIAPGVPGSLHIAQADHKVSERIAVDVYGLLTGLRGTPGAELHESVVFNVLELSPALQVCQVLGRAHLEQERRPDPRFAPTLALASTLLGRSGPTPRPRKI